MKVKNLKITDLRNIEIFEGELGDWNVIGGKNGSGKSTVIDAIFGAIKGKTYFDSEPFRLVKHDKEKAVINLVLEGKNREIIINRTFSAPTEAEPKGYDTLRIVDTSGEKLGQKELNAFFSSFTIDPLHIARQKPKEQIDTIKEIAGIDTSEIENKALETYDKRTIENRELARLKGVITEYAGVEEVKEVSVSELIAERDKKQEENKEIDNIEFSLNTKQTEIKDLDAEIEGLEAKILQLKEEREESIEIMKAIEKDFKTKQKHDLQEITDKINKSEEINEKARKFKLKQENLKKYQDQENICNDLDKLYKDQLQAREDLIKNSNLPDYISFDKTAGVLVNNIPFSQLNTAEQIKIAIQLGAILTPELKILHIKDGSLLDEDTLKIVKEVVEAHDYQVLIERVWEEKLDTIIMREWVKI